MRDVKHDCALWDERHKGCKGLTELVCAKGECKFYKTAEQVRAEEERRKERLEKECGVDPNDTIKVAVADYGRSGETKYGDAAREKSRKRYERLIADGRCVNCGKPNTFGGALCEACRKIRKEQKTARNTSKNTKN